MVAGTIGYVAPEYGQTWKATTKGDVYSYGVLVMELATGRQAIGGGEEYLVEWSRKMVGRRSIIPVSILVSRLSEGATEMRELLRLGVRIFGQQNNFSNVQSNGQHNFSAIYHQHLSVHNRQKQHQSLRTQYGNSTMLNSQHPSHLMQSTQGQRSQMELQQQMIPQLQTQSVQFQHQSNTKQRLPTSFNQQRAMPEASSTSTDSTAQTGKPNSGDGQEEVYQVVKL